MLPGLLGYLSAADGFSSSARCARAVPRIRTVVLALIGASSGPFLCTMKIIDGESCGEECTYRKATGPEDAVALVLQALLRVGPGDYSAVPSMIVFSLS